jgi:UPF0755 protein
MRRLLLFLFLSLLLMLGYCLFAGSWLLLTPVTPAQPVFVDIRPGSNLQQIAQELQHRSVIRSALALKLLARWQDQGAKIQAGRYQFKAAATPSAILQRLLEGDVEKVSLTIPEGFSLEQIITRITAAGYGDEKILRHWAQDPAFIAEMGIPTSSLEGYLFPETYLFAAGIEEKELLRMMVNELYRQLDDRLLRQAKQLNLNRHQLITLASIIEKETAKSEEMPLISSVFHNRLARNMRLQTDPTVIYGIEDFDGNLTRKQLDTPTPYNTYLQAGLPPGPIASPGLQALQAASRPASTDYLYFVARGNGSHQFSRTLKEHNAAVRKYQLRR